MPKFNLSAAVTVSAYTVVEAPTLAEAITLAEGRDVVLGGNGTGADEGVEWVIEDADGSPDKIHAS